MIQVTAICVVWIATVQGFGADEIARFINAELNAFGILSQPSQNSGLFTIIEVIEHGGNSPNLIETAAQLLAPRGWMLVTSPNIYSLRARLRFFFGGGIPFFELAGTPQSVQPDHLHPIVVEVYERKIFEPRYAASVPGFTRKAVVMASAGVND
jgi:hypothetical protein